MAQQDMNSDTMEVRKTHPRAKDCFIISVVPAVLFSCGWALTVLEDAFPAYHFDFVVYEKLNIRFVLHHAVAATVGINPWTILVGTDTKKPRLHG